MEHDETLKAALQQSSGGDSGALGRGIGNDFSEALVEFINTRVPPILAWARADSGEESVVVIRRSMAEYLRRLADEIDVGLDRSRS